MQFDRRPEAIEDPPFARFLFANPKSAWLWLIIRVYVGWQWISAGWEKLHDPAWVGGNAGTALSGFLKGALGKAGGPHPDVQAWYAWFLSSVVVPHVFPWSYLVAVGEFCIGTALILGVLTGIAAFFGSFMNLNFLLAGTVSINPILFALGIGVMLAWKVAGYYGGDHVLLPLLGVPWKRKE